MARCEQCGVEFSNWLGSQKRLCPNCEQQAGLQRPPDILPPEGEAPSQPRVKLPPPVATRVLIAINVAVFLAMAALTREFVDFNTQTVLRWGADFGVLTTSGEWWRMLTAMFLHGGILHIAVNMWALRNLGYTAELLYGRRNFLIIYFLSGLAGSAGTMIWNPLSVSVGASGAIMGLAGALAALVYFKKLPVDRALLRRDVGSVAGVILFTLIIGARLPTIDNSAHVGGVLAGMILGFALPATIFRAERDKPASTGNSAIAAVIIAILLIAGYTRVKVAPDVETYRAELAYEAGNKQEAYAHAAKAAQMHPQSFYSNVMIGLYLLDQDKKVEAIPYLERANRLMPNDRQVKAALDHARGNDR